MIIIDETMLSAPTYWQVQDIAGLDAVPFGSLNRGERFCFQNSSAVNVKYGNASLFYITSFGKMMKAKSNHVPVTRYRGH